MIFHIDGNSFYASCERVFRPDLANSPIAVLTNNDGIIIALNTECRALGFKRGDVFFEVRQKLAKHNVAVFSSNYTLYADMSARMNLIYSRFAPDVELYSIDESFLFFPDWKETDYSEIGRELKLAVTRETGIPVSIGIAPNKTLAKMCNKLAKRQGDICDWSRVDQNEELANYPVGDIWGIGPSKAALLKRHGIMTALDLKRYPLDKAKKHLTITGFRTVQELNGEIAIDRVEEENRQMVSVSRSFQSPVYELNDIITALSGYTQEAVKRMRAEGLSCKYVSVYLMTNTFAKGEQYFNQRTTELPYLSAYLPEIMATAIELLKNIFQSGFKYRKVMIALTGLALDKNTQLDLFDEKHNKRKQREPLMRAFDDINERYGRGAIKLGCGMVAQRGKSREQGAKASIKTAPWVMRRDFLSPKYTTCIGEIPAAF